MTQSLDQWRRDTPGTGSVNHLNNAGAGLMPRVVLDRVIEHLQLESQIGGYEASARQAAAIEIVYARLGSFLGARPQNIAIVENATVAFWQAMAAFDFEAGDRIVTTRNEYASNRITFLAMQKRHRVEVVSARETDWGGPDLEDFQNHLRHPRTRLATICWSPTNSGIIQDAPAMIDLCRKANVPSVVDACQAVGQFPVDCGRLDCDFLTGTSRKFLRGPRGLGFLYISDRMLDAGKYPTNLDGRGATWAEADRFIMQPTARRFENWEFPYALVLGLGEAVAYATDVGMVETSSRAFALAAQVRHELGLIPGVTIMDRGKHLGAICSAAIRGWDANALVEELKRRKINTSPATRSWALLDMDAKQVETALRVSPHYYNTEVEVAELAGAVNEIVGR
ncbi:MAG: aminotransferase class V-fold PLP-dependent enzyme [Gemmatimonadota bacterium]